MYIIPKKIILGKRLTKTCLNESTNYKEAKKENCSV